jgi:hypothetical protein
MIEVAMGETADHPTTIPRCVNCGAKRRVVGFWPRPDPKMYVAAFRCIDCDMRTEEPVPAEQPLPGAIGGSSNHRH